MYEIMIAWYAVGLAIGLFYAFKIRKLLGKDKEPIDYQFLIIGVFSGPVSIALFELFIKHTNEKE